jgi:hypothetical protein
MSIAVVSVAEKQKCWCGPALPHPSARDVAARSQISSFRYHMYSAGVLDAMPGILAVVRKRDVIHHLVRRVAPAATTDAS